MLKQRVITAFVLVVVVMLAIFVFPPSGFKAFIALVLVLASWEWSRLAGLRWLPGRILYTCLYPPALYLMLFLPIALQNFILTVSLFWWLLALVLICLYPRCAAIWNTLAFHLLAGAVVLLPGWLGFLYLRDLDNYLLYILLFLGLVAAADIGAYFTGRRFGRRKLAPAVSPNKTWEGFVGGQLAACAVLWCVQSGLWFAGTQLVLSQVLLATMATVVLTTSSVVGDLFESMIKRQSNTKDSGNLLPGHGGILDRIDSITAAMPVFVYMLMNVGLA